MIEFQNPRPLSERIIYEDRLRKWCERLVKAKKLEGKSYTFFDPAYPPVFHK